MSKKYLIAAAVFVLGSLFGRPALADNGSQANVFAAFVAVENTDLNRARGMNNPEVQDLQGALQAVLDNNSAVDNGSTRTNSINASFDSATGIATVIQNVGNNVIIQTATMVTVNYNN